MEFYEEFFNKENKFQLQELKRNERVINFFCYDFFFYDFKLRNFENVLLEDIFLGEISEIEAKKISEQIFEIFENLQNLDFDENKKICDVFKNKLYN